MGIYDREYYRREGPSFLGSLTGHGRVWLWLIGINAACYVLQLVFQPRGFLLGADSYGWFTQTFWLDPDLVLHGQVWRLLTYAFLHDPSLPLHLVMNMLFLWWFGQDVEDIYGPKEFLAFYLLAATLGGIADVAWTIITPTGMPHFTLGASGAITAVMVVCACHHPMKKILVLMILPVPIWLFVLFNVAQDLTGLIGGRGDHTAFSVHVGGAAFGGLYYWRQWRVMNLVPDLRGWLSERSRPKLRIYHEASEQPALPVTASAPEPPPDTAEQLEAKLDAVLAKVSRTGEGSLTDSERQILMRMSELYKRKRT